MEYDCSEGCPDGPRRHTASADGRVKADNERQVQRAGSEPVTLRAHVNIAALRASGRRGHDGVESEGFASYSVSLEVSRTAIVGTYLLRSLRPFGEHLRRVSVYAIMREVDAQARTGRTEGGDDDAVKEVRRPGVYENFHGGWFAGEPCNLSGIINYCKHDLFIQIQVLLKLRIPLGIFLMTPPHIPLFRVSQTKTDECGARTRRSSGSAWLSQIGARGGHWARGERVKGRPRHTAFFASHDSAPSPLADRPSFCSCCTTSARRDKASVLYGSFIMFVVCGTCGG